MIILDGSGTGAGIDGLRLRPGSDGSTIQGFVIQNYPDDGIIIETSSNTIQCNIIGLAVDGTTSQGNGGEGIYLSNNATFNLIGGDTAAERNTISSNGSSGIDLNNTGVTNNQISGNYLGTDISGTLDRGNGSEGVRIKAGSTSNYVGTNGDGVNDAFEGNVISGNDGDGVNMTDSGTSGNVIAGNIIGLDATGTADLGNVQEGVRMAIGASNNLVGTNGDGLSDLAERNILSGNDEDGVEIRDAGSDFNTIAGNIIGLDITGQNAIPNTFNGILFKSNATGNLAGTSNSDSAEQNIISGNIDNGVQILDTNGNEVIGNIIGLNSSGTVAIPNQSDGVEIDNSYNNFVGDNIISGNNLAGVYLTDGLAIQNIISGNIIGLDAAQSSSIGNGTFGVYTINNASINYIGADTVVIGSYTVEPNIISGNTLDGIAIESNTIRNQISANNVWNNGGLGIDLNNNGVTINDIGDGDTTGNNLQNYPMLSTAVDSGTLQVDGTLDSSSNTTFAVEFFANQSCDPSLYGEGQQYLGSTTVTTNGAGTATISVAGLPSPEHLHLSPVQQQTPMVIHQSFHPVFQFQWLQQIHQPQP